MLCLEHFLLIENNLISKQPRHSAAEHNYKGHLGNEKFKQGFKLAVKVLNYFMDFYLFGFVTLRLSTRHLNICGHKHSLAFLGAALPGFPPLSLLSNYM